VSRDDLEVRDGQGLALLGKLDDEGVLSRPI
jgi:hypothetical protein